MILNKGKALFLGLVLSFIYYFLMSFFGSVVFSTLLVLPKEYFSHFSYANLQLVINSIKILLFVGAVFLATWLYFKDNNILKTVRSATALFVMFIASYFLGALLRALLFAILNLNNFLIQLQWKIIGTIDGFQNVPGYALHYFFSVFMFLALYAIPVILFLLIPRKKTTLPPLR